MKSESSMRNIPTQKKGSDGFDKPRPSNYCKCGASLNTLGLPVNIRAPPSTNDTHLTSLVHVSASLMCPQLISPFLPLQPPRRRADRPLASGNEYTGKLLTEWCVYQQKLCIHLFIVSYFCQHFIFNQQFHTCRTTSEPRISEIM